MAQGPKPPDGSPKDLSKQKEWAEYWKKLTELEKQKQLAK